MARRFPASHSRFTKTAFPRLPKAAKARKQITLPKFVLMLWTVCIQSGRLRNADMDEIGTDARARLWMQI